MLTKLQKLDRRAARYAEQHKDDKISEHGEYMREFFCTHNREERAKKRAYKKAVEDITQYLMEIFKTDRADIQDKMKCFFETE